MLQNTQGIVLRSIKYGETSLVSTIFTKLNGVQTYMVQGVRTAKSRHNKAALLQPATLLDLVSYQHQQKNLQRLKEFQLAHIYVSLQEEIVKNSVALFSVELLLRLLPEHAPLPELFDFVFEYFTALDRMESDEVSNFPLYFIIAISRHLGYELKGEYSEQTPHLNLLEGGFSEHHPIVKPFLESEDASVLSKLIAIENFGELGDISMSSARRFRLLEWYIEFLQRYTQHLGQIKSLSVLQAILH